jgi:hypothetical protein
VLLAAGCAVAHQIPAPGPRPAVMAIENLGNCAWQITAVPTGGPARRATVPVGEMIRWELPAGGYEITQEALAGIESAEAVRHFAMPLASGETYRWRLVTVATVPRDAER